MMGSRTMATWSALRGRGPGAGRAASSIRRRNRSSAISSRPNVRKSSRRMSVRREISSLELAGYAGSFGTADYRKVEIRS
jgi:hypothetical protein